MGLSLPLPGMNHFSRKPWFLLVESRSNVSRQPLQGVPWFQKAPCPRSHSIPKSHSIRAARPGRNESLGNPTCTWNPDLVTICVRWHWDAAFPGPSQVGRGILCGCEHEHIYKSNYSHVCNRLKNGTTKDIHTLILQAVSATSYSCKGGIKEEGDTLLFRHRSCLTLCHPMDCSSPGLPVLHQLRACSNSCPLSQWCHPTISSSVVPFSSRLQSSLASGSFPVSQFFSSGGQSIGVSASASALLMNNQGWFPLGWTGLISLQSKDS